MLYHMLPAHIGKKVDIEWIESEKFENGPSSHPNDKGRKNIKNMNNNTNTNNLFYLKGFDGILIPGGFGKRGSEGIIRAANFARVQNVPYLGICFGFQTGYSRVWKIRMRSRRSQFYGTRSQYRKTRLSSSCLNKKQLMTQVDRCGWAVTK